MTQPVRASITNVRLFGMGVVFLSILGLATVGARADNPASWTFSGYTTGGDISWTSPTAVALGGYSYSWAYEITQASVKTFLGNTSVLDMLEQTSGSASVSGVPFVMLDSWLEEPQTGSSAHMLFEVDDQGYGQVSITDVVLGSYLIFSIQRVDFSATLSVTATPPPGDLDGDFDTDVADMLQWQRDDGSAATKNALLQGFGWGSAQQASLAVVPEPGAWILATGLLALAASVRRRGSYFAK